MSGKPIAIRVALGKAWPSLKYLSLGVWTAWLFLISSGSIWLSDNAFNGARIATMMLYMSIIGALVCFIAPFARQHFERLLANRLLMMGISLIATVGALVIIIGGPYYLDIRWLFRPGLVLISIFSGVFVLKCGSLFGELNPKRVLLMSLGSEIVVVAISYFTVGNDFFIPVSGGPALAGILAFALLPPFATWLACLPASGSGKEVKSKSRIDEDELHSEAPTISAHSESHSTGDEGILQKALAEARNARHSLMKLPKYFWKFLFMIFFFTLASETFHCYFVFVENPAITYIGTKVMLLLRLAFALVVLYYALRTGRQINFSKMYQFSLVALAVVVVLIPLLQDQSAALGSSIGLISICMNLLIWCLLSMVVYEKNMPFLVVFGFGQGVLLIARACGWLLGTEALPFLTGATLEPFFYWGMALVILATTILFFSEKHLDRMFENIAMGGVTLDFFNAKKEPRPWHNACIGIGKRYSLSQREQEVFELMATGRSPMSISKHLSVSINTVRSHIRGIYAKLDAHSREELMELIEHEIEFADKDRALKSIGEKNR